MLLSLIKKITSSSSNEAQTNTHNTTTQTTQVVKPEKEEFCDGKYYKNYNFLLLKYS